MRREPATPTPPRGATETCVGSLARALGVRALPVPGDFGRALVPSAGADDGGGPWAFALAAQALADAPLRRLVDGLPGASLGPHVPLDADPADGAGEQVLLHLPPTAVRALRGRGTDAAEGGAAEDPGAERADVLLAVRAALDAPPREPRLMGVVNVTPDSFSDGGRYLDPGRAVEHGLRLVAEGAHVLDVGGESTRPGAAPVSAEEELARVLPVLRGLAGQAPVPLSIDTTKAAVAEAALDAGATWVNDVSAGLHDPGMLPLVGARGAVYVAMHAQGRPADMQAAPRYGDPVADVAAALRERAAAALGAGVDPGRLWLDPGIGFGKRLAHNLALLRRLPELRGLGLPLLLGVSRKSFIAHLTGAEEEAGWRLGTRSDAPAERLGGTAAAVAACVRGGAEMLRVHDVRMMAEAARVAWALARPDRLP